MTFEIADLIFVKLTHVENEELIATIEPLF
jgi:hypothetical protein